MNFINDQYSCLTNGCKESMVSSHLKEVNREWSEVRELIRSQHEELETRLTLLQEFERDVCDFEKWITGCKDCDKEQEETREGVSRLENAMSKYKVKIWKVARMFC